MIWKVFPRWAVGNGIQFIGSAKDEWCRCLQDVYKETFMNGLFGLQGFDFMMF